MDSDRQSRGALQKWPLRIFAPTTQANGNPFHEFLGHPIDTPPPQSARQLHIRLWHAIVCAC